MRATTSLALFALATGPANAVFCFVKEEKCLPGVELSLDYDKIPGLLGITTTKAIAMRGTAVPTVSASPVVVPAASKAEVDTAEVPLPLNMETDFLKRLLKKPAAIEAPSTLGSPAVAPAVAPMPAPAPLVAPVPVAMPALAPAVAAAPVPAAIAPMASPSPLSPVPDWVRNLIPRGYEETPPIYTGSAETNDYHPASQVAAIPSAYAAPSQEDVTTTITEWATVTPTHTVSFSESSTSQKVVQTYAAPNSTTSKKETYATLLPKPSASQSETITLTTTIVVWVPAPTFSTAVSYSTIQKPVEVTALSYPPAHSKAAIYPIPSNATTVQSIEYVKPTMAKPTIYVTPIPASYSPWSKTQNMSRPELPEQYTGAAAANALNSFFMMAAGLAAMMAL